MFKQTNKQILLTTDLRCNGLSMGFTRFCISDSFCGSPEYSVSDKKPFVINSLKERLVK